MQLVVLAAGLGTRFGGLKQLASVGPDDEAIMDVLLERAARSGFDRAAVVVRSEIETVVVAHLSEFPPALSTRIVVQPVPDGRQRPLGTAHAVLCCRGEIDGPFAVVNADDLYPDEAFVALAPCLATSHGHALVAFRLERTLVADRPVSRALVRVDPDNDCLAAIEENTTVQRSSVTGDAWVSMNMWGFQPAIFGDLEQAVDAFTASEQPGEVLLPDVAAAMVARGAKIRVLRCDKPCIGITYAEDVAAVRAALA